MIDYHYSKEKNLSLTTSCTKHMVITTEVMNIQGELKFRIMPNKGSNMWPESPVEAEVSQSDRVRLGGDFLD